MQLASSPDAGYGTRVDRVRVLAGRLFDPHAAGQAMIDQDMAAAEHLKPGGTVRVLVVPNDSVTGTPDFAKAVPVAFLVTAVVAFDPQIEIADGGYNSPTVLASAPFSATPIALRGQLRHRGRRAPQAGRLRVPCSPRPPRTHSPGGTRARRAGRGRRPDRRHQPGRRAGRA